METERTLLKKCLAELIGTFILVYIGAGAAAITLLLAKGETWQSDFSIGIGALGGLADWLAIGLAFAIAVAASIYIFGHISGCHINPAVTIALWAVKRFPGKEVIPYIISQLIGATLASVLFVTIMALAVDERTPKHFAGLIIGLVVGAGIITTGNITGASFNPARTFGPYLGNTLFGGPNLWAQFPIYIIGPVIGAIIAAFLYTYIAELKT